MHLMTRLAEWLRDWLSAPRLERLIPERNKYLNRLQMFGCMSLRDSFVNASNIQEKTESGYRYKKKCWPTDSCLYIRKL